MYTVTYDPPQWWLPVEWAVIHHSQWWLLHGRWRVCLGLGKCVRKSDPASIFLHWHPTTKAKNVRYNHLICVLNPSEICLFQQRFLSHSLFILVSLISTLLNLFTNVVPLNFLKSVVSGQVIMYLIYTLYIHMFDIYMYFLIVWLLLHITFIHTVLLSYCVINFMTRNTWISLTWAYQTVISFSASVDFRMDLRWTSWPTRSSFIGSISKSPDSSATSAVSTLSKSHTLKRNMTYNVCEYIF